MARVQLGGGVTAIAGRVGGSIFQRGRAGQQMKAGQFTKNRVTHGKGTSRSVLASVSQYWRTLDTTRKTGWNALASGLTRVNSFGVSYVPSGFQIFCECNLNLQKCGIPSLLNTAPAPPTLPTFNSISADLDITAPEFLIDWNTSGSLTDYELIISSTRMQSGAIMSNRAAFTILQAGIDPTTPPVDILTPFGKVYNQSPVVDSVIFVRVQLVHSVQGWATPFVEFRAVAHT